MEIAFALSKAVLDMQVVQATRAVLGIAKRLPRQKRSGFLSFQKIDRR